MWLALLSKSDVPVSVKKSVGHDLIAVLAGRWRKNVVFHRFDQADLEKMLYIKAHLQKDMAHFHIDARQLDEIGKV